MATAEPIPQTENLEWHKHHQLLISVSKKCGFAAKYLDNQKDTIHRIRVAALATGAVGVVGSFFTFGATFLICGAALVWLLTKLAKISHNALKTKEMDNFKRDWERAKSVARCLTAKQIPGDCNVEHLKEWAKEHLDRESAEAVVFFLSAPSACDPDTTDRLERLDQKQLEVLLQSLMNVIIADLSAFELITAPMASKKADAAAILTTLSGDIEKLAEEEDKRQKDIQEQLRNTAFVEPSDVKPSVEKRKRTPADLRMNLQEDFCIHSKRGGKFQLRNSDIILDIPPSTFPVEEAHIKAAVCTDLHHIHTKFQLNDDERVVSPLVEYKLLEPFEFLKPVSVSLPHLLPDNFDLDKVNVYHVSRNKDGTFTKQRVVDYTTSVQQDDNSQGKKIHRINIKTSTFSYFFICAVCETKESGFPALWAVVSGQFAPSGPWGHQQFKAQIFIWDRRLKVADFRRDYEIPFDAVRRPLRLLKHWENTRLHVSVEQQKGQILVPKNDGCDLTEKEEVFDLPQMLTCDECLTENKSLPMWKEWLLYTKHRDTSVTVCIAVQHRGSDQQCVSNKFLYSITRDEAISREAIRTLRTMASQQPERVEAMGFSADLLQNIGRHFGRGMPDNARGAEAAKPRSSTSDNRQLSVASPPDSSEQERSTRLPVGIPETREEGQRDDHGSHATPVADISHQLTNQQAPETIRCAIQLDELKFQ